jgi:hypothetical protein
MKIKNVLWESFGTIKIEMPLNYFITQCLPLTGREWDKRGLNLGSEWALRSRLEAGKRVMKSGNAKILIT